MPATELPQTPPLVSIVTPAYNAVATLEAAIRSVLAQDYPSVEHVIVDGASSDGTLAVLERFADRVRWLSEPDKGQSDALNKGFALARGEIIGWLNADDVYYPGAVSRAVAHLVAHPEVTLVFSDFDFIDRRGQPIRRIAARDFAPEKLLFANIVPQATVFFRRCLLPDVGGISPDYNFVLDWEFVLRVARRHSIERIPGVAGGFRLMTGTKSVAQAAKFWPEFITVLEQSAFLKDWVPNSILAEARCRAQAYAGIEFLRAGLLEQGRRYINQALSEIDASDEAAIFEMLRGILSTTVYPWHAGGIESPQADACLEKVCQALPNTASGRHLMGLLCLYQGYRALKRLRPGRAVQHWRKAFRTWPRLWRDVGVFPARLRVTLHSRLDRHKSIGSVQSSL
jgi:glycosyltransferase involved in cell wall biosynthesis